MSERRVWVLAAVGIAALIGCGGEGDFQPAADSGPRSTLASGVGAPSSATAVATSESAIEVRWQDTSSKETGFRVERSTTGPGGPFDVRTTTGSNVTRYTDGGLAAGMQYCYRIAAISRSGTSGFSNTACAITPAQPGAPTNAIAKPQNSTAVVVAWSGSGNEDGFRLERAAGPAGPWESAGTTGRDVTALVDMARSSEVPVCYRVIAFNAYGVSAPSNVACTTPPAAPQALAALSIDASSIVLSWTDQSAAESGYYVQRALDQNGPFGTVANLSANASRYVDSGLASNAMYWYRVRATKDGGFSDFSNAASAFVSSSIATRPNAPSEAGARPLFSTLVTVWWTDNSSNENGFRIERSTDAGASWNVTTTTVASSNSWGVVNDEWRSSEMEVCYRVIAFNDAGDSAPSNTSCTIPPAGPTNLVVTSIQEDTYELTWSDNSAVEDGYEARFSNGESYCSIYSLPANSTKFYYGIDRYSDPGGYCISWIEVVATRDGGYSDGASWP
jgi:uncharacterized protein